MIHLKRNVCLFFILLFTISSFANKPHVINLYKEKYHAANKNWSIAQDEKGVVYFGNDIGLLEFDGVEWHLNQMPNSLLVRSTAVLSHETIFTGSYEEFGRWDRDASGKLKYTSLSDGVDKNLFKNDDFWKIWVTPGFVYFQSFNSIYIYDYKTVKRIPGIKSLLFLSKVRDEFLVQEIGGELFRLKGESLEKIAGSDIFRNTDVRVILPYSTNKYLIGTTTKGIYIYDGSTFKEWNSALSATMKLNELNCGIRTSRNTYLLGTILNGIYEVDESGNVINHISSENRLQNNTVLSLYEDNLNNIWVALDRGIAYIQYVENMNYYTDYDGSMGAVYDAVLWKGSLFVGTNQGLFHISQEALSRPNDLSDMKLINGTQGQVWSLIVVDGKLYCCHNKGLKQIQENLSVTIPYPTVQTGVYHLTPARIKDRNLLLLSTYTSLILIDTDDGTVNPITDVAEPIIKTEVDHLENIWMQHANRGVYRAKLSEDMKSFRSFVYYGGNRGDNLPYKLSIFKVGGRIVLLGDGLFYTYDDIADKIVPNKLLNECFKNIKNVKRVVNIQNNMFWALTNNSIYKFSYDGYEAYIMESYNITINNLSLVNAYENVSVLNDSLSLICLDNGFLLYKTPLLADKHRVPKMLYTPYIKSLEITNTIGDVRYQDLSKQSGIPYNFNTITFHFSVNDAFASNRYVQYMLEGVDKDWSTAQKINKVSYARLPEGKYVFKIRTVGDLGDYSEPVLYHFEILSPWYLTFWAYVFYVVLFMGICYIVWVIILRRYRNLHLQKIRHRETRRLRMLTDKLRHEVETKNAELLTQTSFIIQKNELILKIKDIVDEFYSKNKTSMLAPLYQKINLLLNNNMDTEDDWKMFLIKFEQKHTEFFKKLKSLYPQLTNNDLRLCACLKLNLETKEIASLMNLSVRAVENSRYRLRKKLYLQPSQNLNDFFLSID